MLALQVPQRIEQVKRLKLCLNCLRSSHRVDKCKISGCRKCGARHNTLLHLDKRPLSDIRSSHSVTEDAVDQNTLEDEVVVATSCSNLIKPQFSQVLLSTAVIGIKNFKNEFIQCRALLDSGSQVNFITRELVNKLNLKVHRKNIPISGINQMVSQISNETHLTLRSLHNNYKTDISCLILDNITSEIPLYSFNISNLEIPKNLTLADPEFNHSGKIDILLGASIFFDLLGVGQIRLGKNKPLLQKTLLGWIVSGSFSIQNSNVGNRQVCHFAKIDIDATLKRFWSIEEVQAKKIHSREEVECEINFVNTVSRDENGRFCVTLPLKNNIFQLGDSLDTARHRFRTLETKLHKNPVLRKNYCDFMLEYRQLGHMTKLSDQEINIDTPVYYLPHHAVVNEASETTKLRVVFDASAKTSKGISLNDALKVGPTVQDELFDILVRFRQHNVVLTADIEKMYRQVQVDPTNRELQRILWRDDPTNPIEHFRLNTVTYGTASASFLSTRCLKQISIDIKDSNPRLSDVISKCFYVDDFIFTTQFISDAIDLGQSLTDILAKYGFPLRKWCSNKPQILEALSQDKEKSSGYFITNDDTKKTLGVFWTARQDTLEYVINIRNIKDARVTKRLILSLISQIFDPLGLVGPVTITAKIILQKLWKLKLDWDEAITLDLLSLWNRFYTNLDSLNSIRISRQCVIDNAVNIECHGFCDASETSYGACLYLKSIDASGKVLVRLVCAKSRVAPLKCVSIPRLELCGALLLSQLADKVLSALDISISRIYYWTDSTIVLSWLAQEPSTWTIFVANRVAEIQGLSEKATWNHVNSADNPADIISRGVIPSELKSLDLWWTGPVWLQSSAEDWPLSSFISENIPERKKHKIILVGLIQDRTIFELKSTLFELLKLVAWCFRFFHNSRIQATCRNLKPSLTVSEMDSALIYLIKVAQNQDFFTEVISLQKHGYVHKTSHIKSLDPFFKDDLILVGGRLSNSKEAFGVKHPIILPHRHPLTRLIILDHHRKHLHAGAQALLAILRQRFWIINARSTIRAVLAKCHTCIRVKPISFTQKMGNLPKARIIPQRPFYSCGIDFAGPFNLKDGKLRNRKIIKSYMCLFICFVTKAVHIELVGELSTDSFLNCLKRFVSRRGLCKHIYTDNGSNFVGASNELARIHEALSKVQHDIPFKNYCLDNHIEWHFIPARSPHQGGLWESAIKSAKAHLIRIIGNRNLLFEDLCTIFSQIEAVLNSRPLIPLSSDPNDLEVLTPGHFLIGDSLCALPQRDVMAPPVNRLSHYQQMQQIVQHLWSRWNLEYLATLQQRTKWHGPSANVKVGSLVILKEDSTPPLCWKIGRVVELYPGPDGLVRVASVKTGSGIVRRAIQKLCALPVEKDIVTPS